MKRWTDADRALLRDLWQRNATRETLVARLGHPWISIAREARAERLPMLCEGWVSLNEAARRSGYDRATLPALLARLGVRSRPHPRPFHTRARSSRGVRVVSWPALERALRAWGAQRPETQAQAAVRLGVSRPKLQRWAHAAGLSSGRQGVPVYHPRATWDALVARMGLETVAQAARRLGVSASTVREWMTRAGVRPAWGIGRHHHAPEVYDAARAQCSHSREAKAA